MNAAKGQFKVLIVGLGRIGMYYDLKKPLDEFVFTHARAFANHPSFRLVGGVDPLSEHRDAFTGAYSCLAYESISDAIPALKPDIVVIATPTALHHETITKALAIASNNKTEIKAILCEKPLAPSLSEARATTNLCAAHHCKLFVNYMRCCDVTTQVLRSLLKTGEIESPIRGIVWYSKGLYNSASHFVNLLQDLFGKETGISLIDPGKKALENGTPETEREPDFRLSFSNADFTFLAVANKSLFHNSMEWLAKNGRLRYEKGGAQVFWDAAKDDPVFAGYRNTGEYSAKPLTGDFYRVQYHVAQQLADALSEKYSFICSGEQATRTIETLELI